MGAAGMSCTANPASSAAVMRPTAARASFGVLCILRACHPNMTDFSAAAGAGRSRTVGTGLVALYIPLC